MLSGRSTRLIIGCGYLGLRVARRWVAAGERVAALTRSVDRAAEFRSMGIEPVVGDVLEPATLAGLPSATTVLYAVGYDRAGSASKRRVFVEGLRNVLAALPPSVERFVYVSSTSVYGRSDGEWVDEQSPCEPASEGGRICLDAENLLRTTLEGTIPVQILRLSGLYGPGRLIARIDALRERRPMTGNPDGWLNLIHVDDAVAAVIACSDREGEISDVQQWSAGVDVLLVSDDRPIRRRTYFEAIARHVNAPPPVFEPHDGRSDLGKRCRNQRLRKSLAIPLKYPTIEDGLKHAIRDA